MHADWDETAVRSLRYVDDLLPVDKVAATSSCQDKCRMKGHFEVTSLTR
jgi:hypothetical protein